MLSALRKQLRQYIVKPEVLGKTVSVVTQRIQMSSSMVEARRPSVAPEADPSTRSSYKNVQVDSTRLALRVNWENKVLSGKVEYSLGRVSASSIVLDSSFLDISKATFNGNQVDFKLSNRVEPLGQALSIELGSVPPQGSHTLAIEFATTDKCTALQWLTPEQTAGKKIPYMFSQCQAIHARSLFPCFDTPSVKSTYKFSVASKYSAVMSGNTADNATGINEFAASGDTVYEFEQSIPIPSYLVAIASGDLKSAEIGPRSLVYTEPSKLDACKYEFEADTENFIQAAEKIVFPYEWKTYNVLVLPPSFPYGGMENPNITFATPTLISGDRQNVDVIAHELAHSWSGNLVTNASWEHFWLNEGWTVYLERRIVGAVHGEAHRHFSAIIGWSQLEEAIQTLGADSEFTCMVVDLKGNKDPDDAFSTVPYEKGFNFLFYLENLLGGKPVFDPFIPYYFGAFKGKSLDSYQFRDTVYEFFKDKKDVLDTIDWDSWFYKPGLPPKPKFDTSIADTCYALVDKWSTAIESGDFSGFSLSDMASWTSSQQVVFLDVLADRFEKLALDKTHTATAQLDKFYGLSSSHNPEVVSRWFRLAIVAQLTSTYQPLADWLGTVGRMKFVRPGFRQLSSVDRSLALKTFASNEYFYHPICRTMVKKDLGL
jgi:leukotriene-A4 hydrolase